MPREMTDITTRPERRDVSVGLALGGGGARGIAHIHALAAVDELGIRPAMIAGTSIGAILGAAYASGMSADDIRSFARQRLGDRWALMSDLIRAAGKGSKSAMPLADARMRRRFDPLRLIGSLLPADFPARFEDLGIPLKISATDFFAQTEQVFDHGPLLPALAASAAVPVVFRPVTVNGHTYIDGGATNPVPFDLLRPHVDVVIAIDVIGDNAIRSAKPVRRIDALTASSHIMQRAIVTAKRAAFEPDVLIRPEIGGVRVHEFLRIEEILDRCSAFKEVLKDRINAAVAAAEAR